eukprot:TRINITY_DN40890_c0_g1_i1.p1 TRINITY_DN40890_c0_g1~~TRINITY_DN40890_c0_g1_i1.p1  ORF type:complete len:677 (-),score=120.07 TRINITY_DN40890_c0_g1_i1:2-2032(-)
MPMYAGAAAGALLFQKSSGDLAREQQYDISAQLETVIEGSETSGSTISRASSANAPRLKNYHMSRWASDHSLPEGATKQMAETIPEGDEDLEESSSRRWSRWKELSCRDRIRSFLQSTSFDALIGIVIVANAVSIGVEQSFRGTSHKVLATTAMLDDIFLSIYMIELALRFYAFRLACLRDTWVLFDLFLVVMGVITQWILSPILGSQMDQVGPLMVLRTVRLMRLAKTVRLLIKFKELWMLVRGLLNSLSTMIYTILLLFVLLYIFACIGLELLFDHPKIVGPEADEAFARTAKLYFSSLPMSMLSLMQFVSLDNLVMIYGPLAKHDPALCAYFVFLILVVGIVVMNLVTAVIVNSALEQTAQDKDLLKTMDEKHRKQVLKDLRRVFLRLDHDHSGEISRTEIQSMGSDELEILRNLTGMNDPLEIFDALDIDGSGDIGIDEFCDGLWNVAISQTPIEIKRMEKQMEHLRYQMKEAKADRSRLHQKVAQILEVVQALQQSKEDADVDRAAEEYSPHQEGLVEELKKHSFDKITDGVKAAVAKAEHVLREATIEAAVPAVFSALELAMDGALSEALDHVMRTSITLEEASASRRISYGKSFNNPSDSSDSVSSPDSPTSPSAKASQSLHSLDTVGAPKVTRSAPSTVVESVPSPSFKAGGWDHTGENENVELSCQV